jgi:bacterial/archaeal transporter family-2 protein
MWYFYGLALLAGIASAIEPGQNASLAKATGTPLLAGLLCCALGTAVFGTLWLATGRAAWPGGGQAPWWAWAGGLLGALVVLAQLYASQKIGAAPFLGIVVTAGVATSITLDHFGLVGFAQHAASPWRLAGAGLMIAGVALVALF